MTYQDQNNKKLERAKKRVGEIKAFYVHFAVYVVVNSFILVNIYLGLNKGESFWQLKHFLTLLFWGIGVLGHAAGAFQYNPFFSKAWEKRQLQKYIDEDKREMEKYK